MLVHTFCHIPGIGLKTEHRLWEAGVTTWEAWQDPCPVRLSAIVRNDAAKILERSREALAGEPVFFTKNLASTEPWRIFPHFREKTVYLDIETTGLDDGAEITCIALYDGREILTYVNGINLEAFVDDILRYQVIVTYNGKSFDIPFIERYFRIRLDHAQIDLRHVLGRLGFRGGLKGCEKQLGMNRGALDGVDGYFAVLLWHRYRTCSDPQALETLIAYNVEDTVNLERLMVEAYNRNILATPFADNLLLPFPEPPANPYQPDYDCIERIRWSRGGWQR